MQLTSSATRAFDLGGWRVRPRLSRIERGAEFVHVTPRAMAVLVHLAEANGAVVSRNAILDAVWPRVTVTPDALARCLVELRKALGDGINGSRIIETIPKVGVRLTVPVVVIADDQTPVAAPAPAKRRFAYVGATAGLLALGVGALAWFWLAGPDPASSATSDNPQARAYFSSALDYSNRPNRVEALPHEEALYRRAVEQDPEFAQAWAGLGHAHLGAYWYGIDRTPARLVRAEEALQRALALQHDLPAAHLYLADFYFKGRGDSAAALAEFAIAEHALAADAELYFLRASVYRRGGAWQLAAADNERAAELDARNVVYWRQLHITRAFMRDFARAEQALDGILSLAPDDGTTYVDKVALALQSSGDTRLADQYDARPPSALYDEGLAYVYTAWLAAVFARDYERGLRVLAASADDQVFNGDLRNSAVPKAALYARTYRLAGNPDRARTEYEAVARDTEPRVVAAIAAASDAPLLAALYLTLAEAQAALGRREQALASMEQARQLVPKSADALLGSATQLAAVLNVLVPAGETALGIRELDDYLSAPGHWAIEGLRADPRLDAMRADALWAPLVAKHARP